MNIDYSELRPLDLVVFSGKGFNPGCCRFSSTGSIFKIRDKSIACHIGTIIEWQGNYFIAESRSGGVQINPIQKYLDIKGSRYILDVKRHPVYDDPEKADRVMKNISLDLFNHVGFDYEGMFFSMFVLFGIPYRHDNKKFYCSEYYYHLTKTDILYPASWVNNRILPEMLNKFDQFYSINVMS